MSNLTGDQFRSAHRLLLDNGYAVSGTLPAELAPLMQLPWDEPTDEEFIDIVRADPTSFYGEEILRSMKDFVRRRNAALLPKPVDPRREKVLAALQAAYPRLNGAPWSAPFIADVVLEALGPEYKFGFSGFKELSEDPKHPYLDSMLKNSDIGQRPMPREPFKRNSADEAK